MCIMVTEEPFYMVPIATFSDQKYYLYQKTWTRATTHLPHKILINHIILYIREVWLSCKCIFIINVYCGDRRALLQGSDRDIQRPVVLFMPKTWIRTSTPAPHIILEIVKFLDVREVWFSYKYVFIIYVYYDD